MTAAAGFPTLRLVRVRVGQLSAAGMERGEVREVRREDVLGEVEEEVEEVEAD